MVCNNYHNNDLLKQVLFIFEFQFHKYLISITRSFSFLKDGSNPESPFFHTIYFRFSIIKQKITHHHLKFFPIHFVVVASENLHNYTNILHCEHLQVICTIIQNMLIIVGILILCFRCNRYFVFLL